METEWPGYQVRRKFFTARVKPGNGIVEGLAGKGNAVFCGSQFFLKLYHILIGLEIRIVLRQGKTDAPAFR